MPRKNDSSFARYRSALEERAQTQMRQPFLSASPMDGPPTCSLEAFKQPRLRRCPFDLKTLSITDRINPKPIHFGDGVGTDGGLDGYNWIVRFGKNSDLFVLKIFWDTEPPKLPGYFAAQRECQNAALLQMLQEAMLPDHADLGPILINHNPETRKDAEANLFAFSSEIRNQQRNNPRTSSLEEVTTIPRMRQCYGWLQLTSDDLSRLIPQKLYPPSIKVSKIKRCLKPDACYYGIVYEFVEEGKNDQEVVKQALTFFWRLGFSHWTTKADNWKSGVLIDHSDIVHTRGCGWSYRWWRREITLCTGRLPE